MPDNMLRNRRRIDPFLTGAVWLVGLGCLVVTVVPAVLTDATAFRGSLAFSGLVSLAFATQNLRSMADASRPELPASIVTTVFGLWFVAAPLRYADAGLYATAVAQAAGLIVAAFGGYLTVTALVGDRDDDY
jgi:FtsH-binding integral membrane protein